MADPKDNNNDNWKRAVDMLTGYVLPARDALFEHLKGNDDIPLMHVRIVKEGGPEYASGFLSGGGWYTHNTNYTFPFYSPHDANSQDVHEGDSLYRWRAYITFIGTAQEGGEIPSGEHVIPGWSKTSDVLKSKGGDNSEGDKLSWDTNALAQYIYGSKAAISQLILSPHSTHGFENRGIAVDDAGYVDLNSFTDVARAFDRAARFFEDSAVTVSTWDAEDIGEGSESWDGTAAAIFKELIHKLARNYEGYADQINGEAGDTVATTIDGVSVTSAPAQALANVQAVILEQAKNLTQAWRAWRNESNPWRWLYDMLQEARLNFFDTQSDKTDIETRVTGSGASTDYDNFLVATAGFQNSIIIDGKSYGPPSQTETWKSVGSEAVRRWEQSVQNFLDVEAAKAIVVIHDAFTDARKMFDTRITDKDNRSISEIAAKEEADKEKKDAEREKAEARAEQEAAKAEAEREKAEARAEQEAAKAEAEREKAEARAEQEA
ncbi:AAWKG family protein, partial [Streptomyces antibioticus]|uniref:AAWKG family protein n=1 Tax=Streptomyces antibioticus TaxID=1890 RepID=UPI0036B0EF6E